jgi:hypothetical protein
MAHMLIETINDVSTDPGGPIDTTFFQEPSYSLNRSKENILNITADCRDKIPEIYKNMYFLPYQKYKNLFSDLITEKTPESLFSSDINDSNVNNINLIPLSNLLGNSYSVNDWNSRVESFQFLSECDDIVLKNIDSNFNFLDTFKSIIVNLKELHISRNKKYLRLSYLIKSLIR